MPAQPLHPAAPHLQCARSVLLLRSAALCISRPLDAPVLLLRSLAPDASVVFNKLVVLLGVKAGGKQRQG